MESSSISYGYVAIRSTEIAEQISKERSTERVITEAKLLLPCPIPIYQWSCRGHKINSIEITLRDQAFLPIAFYFQESHLKK